MIGRGEDVHLRLEDAWISREHLVVEPREEGGWGVRDLGSENGSVLNDAAVTESVIAHGDRLRIGATEMRFFHQEAAPAEEPETLVERLQRRIEDLEDENRRLRRLAAESGVRQARPRGARRPGVPGRSYARGVFRGRAASRPRPRCASPLVEPLRCRTLGAHR